MIRDILIQHGRQPHIGTKDSPGENVALETLKGTVLRRPNWGGGAVQRLQRWRDRGDGSG